MEVIRNPLRMKKRITPDHPQMLSRVEPRALKPRMAVVEDHPQNRKPAQAVEFGQVLGQPGWALDRQDSRLSGQRSFPKRWKQTAPCLLCPRGRGRRKGGTAGVLTLPGPQKRATSTPQTTTCPRDPGPGAHALPGLQRFPIWCNPKQSLSSGIFLSGVLSDRSSSLGWK